MLFELSKNTLFCIYEDMQPEYSRGIFLGKSPWYTRQIQPKSGNIVMETGPPFGLEISVDFGYFRSPSVALGWSRWPRDLRLLRIAPIARQSRRRSSTGVVIVGFFYFHESTYVLRLASTPPARRETVGIMSHGGRNECRIYVGNLPPDIRTKDIQDLFYKFGKVTFVDLKNRRGPPFAFVEFDDPRWASERERFTPRVHAACCVRYLHVYTSRFDVVGWFEAVCATSCANGLEATRRNLSSEHDEIINTYLDRKFICFFCIYEATYVIAEVTAADSGK